MMAIGSRARSRVIGRRCAASRDGRWVVDHWWRSVGAGAVHGRADARARRLSMEVYGVIARRAGSRCDGACDVAVSSSSSSSAALTALTAWEDARASWDSSYLARATNDTPIMVTKMPKPWSQPTVSFKKIAARMMVKMTWRPEYTVGRTLLTRAMAQLLSECATAEEPTPAKMTAPHALAGTAVMSSLINDGMAMAKIAISARNVARKRNVSGYGWSLVARLSMTTYAAYEFVCVNNNSTSTALVP
mmetsp:Transcript_3052/g.10142  ORF Transcript_3052/g.10142 Transcript_3052/m.10142 type:complete len:247 (+) Transcript_3052:774-1514(+)